MTVYIIGLGVGSWRNISLYGYGILKKVSKVFIERYTNPIPTEDIIGLSSSIGKEVIELSREDLEVKNILCQFADEDIALITPGDPMIATTHQQLYIDLIRRGIDVKVVNASSIITVAIGRSGLHPYKFGPFGTITRPEVAPPDSVYKLLVNNLKRGLHSIILLEYDHTTNYIMKPDRAMEILYALQAKYKCKLPTRDQIVLILSKLGYKEEKIVGIYWGEKPSASIEGPSVLIVPGKLHFTESEYIREVLKIDAEKVR